MRTISTVGLRVNISPPAAFGGWMTVSSWQKLSKSNQLTASRATYLRWTWSTHRTYTTRTIHIRWHRSARWFRRSGCRSISTTSSALGLRQQRLKSWSQTSTTRTAMCFYRNLQLYLSLGLRLTVVHRALRFNQSSWMEPYIRMNTELRKKAASDFEKDLYKLMNNSVFGKTMENLRRRVDVPVRSNEEDKLRRLIASPAFARANIFDDDLAAIQVHKSRLVLNRPVFVGMSILDLSKHLMYDFYYNQLRGQYGDRCQLLYTDTDSLLLEVQTEEVFRDMASQAELYDTSDYQPEHSLHSIANKKMLGKMKDECAGRPIAEYVGLRPKMYSILAAGRGNIKKAKGVKKNVVKKHIRHEQYKEALFRKLTFRHSMDVLRSERHRIYGQRLNKVSLSPFDSKRWIAENGVDTLAYGHKDTLPAGAAEMDAYIDELLSTWEPHPEEAECRAALRGVPPWQNYAAGRPASNTTQARRAWSPRAPAGTSQETTRGQSRGADRPPARQAGTDSEHQHLKGASASWDQHGGRELQRRAFASRSWLWWYPPRGPFASQPGDLTIQSRDNARQPSHPLCWPLTRREAHLLGVLVPKQPLCEGPVPALYDPLIPVDVNPTAPNLNRVLCQQLAHRTHELAPRVNLKELQPLQWPPSVDPRQSIGDLRRGLASQRLSLFEARGHSNDRESVAVGFPPHAVVRQKEQIRLVDLVRRGDVKLRPRYAPWGRQIDLPDGLPFEPVLGLLLSHLCCRRQLDGCEPLPVASGAVV